MDIQDLKTLYTSDWDSFDYDEKNEIFEHYSNYKNFEDLFMFVLENEKFKKFLSSYIKNYNFDAIRKQLYWGAHEEFSKYDNERNIFYSCAEAILVSLGQEWEKVIKEVNCDFKTIRSTSTIDFDFNIIHFEVNVKSFESTLEENIEKIQEYSLNNETIGDLKLDCAYFFKSTNFFKC